MTTQSVLISSDMATRLPSVICKAYAPCLLGVAGAELFDEHTPLAHADWKNSNKELLNSLREDTSAEELMRLTVQDAQLGRMTEPTSPDALDLDKVRLHILQLQTLSYCTCLGRTCAGEAGAAAWCHAGHKTGWHTEGACGGSHVMVHEGATELLQETHAQRNEAAECERAL